MTNPPAPYVYPARLVRVVDGDTVDLMVDQGFRSYRQERVRLIGVNTPEIVGPKAATEGPEGQRAKQVTADWLTAASAAAPDGWPLIYRSDRYDEREKYGRSLGTILNAAGESLNAVLIAQGWAE